MACAEPPSSGRIPSATHTAPVNVKYSDLGPRTHFTFRLPVGSESLPWLFWKEQTPSIALTQLLLSASPDASGTVQDAWTAHPGQAVGMEETRPLSHRSRHCDFWVLGVGRIAFSLPFTENMP